VYSGKVSHWFFIAHHRGQACREQHCYINSVHPYNDGIVKTIVHIVKLFPTSGRDIICFYILYRVTKFFVLSINHSIAYYVTNIIIILSTSSKRTCTILGALRITYTYRTVLRAVRTCRPNTIRTCASKYWNKLTEPLRISSSFAIFQFQMKDWLVGVKRHFQHKEATSCHVCPGINPITYLL